jgi:hypothetical protein
MASLASLLEFGIGGRQMDISDIKKIIDGFNEKYPKAKGKVGISSTSRTVEQQLKIVLESDGEYKGCKDRFMKAFKRKDVPSTPGRPIAGREETVEQGDHPPIHPAQRHATCWRTCVRSDIGRDVKGGEEGARGQKQKIASAGTSWGPPGGALSIATNVSVVNSSLPKIPCP